MLTILDLKNALTQNNTELLDATLAGNLNRMIELVSHRNILQGLLIEAYEAKTKAA